MADEALLRDIWSWDVNTSDEIKKAHVCKAKNLDLSGANLSGAYLGQVDLAQVDLSGSDLYRANLYSSYLEGANLYMANMCRASLYRTKLYKAYMEFAELDSADLTKAQLQGANLSGASLTNANLSYANLSGANLKGANLWRANLTEANLSGADLTNTRIEKTLFINCNISSVTGLDRANHSGPSTIDHLTIQQSGGLPDYFLRGCGLPEPLIEYYPSLLNQPVSYYSCFISYSHNDKSFARRLHDALQGIGIRCWLDEHQLLPGDDIYKEVDRALSVWDKVLLCASESSLKSWWVDNEINSAFKKEQLLMKDRGRKVHVLIPLNLDNAIFKGDWGEGKSEQVKSRLAADFTGWELDNAKFEDQFMRVVNALVERGKGGREIPPAPKI